MHFECNELLKSYQRRKLFLPNFAHNAFSFLRGRELTGAER
jgi:hypothetical protein